MGALLPIIMPTLSGKKQEKDTPMFLNGMPQKLQLHTHTHTHTRTHTSVHSPQVGLGHVPHPHAKETGNADLSWVAMCQNNMM